MLHHVAPTAKNYFAYSSVSTDFVYNSLSLHFPSNPAMTLITQCKATFGKRADAIF